MAIRFERAVGMLRGKGFQAERPCAMNRACRNEGRMRRRWPSCRGPAPWAEAGAGCARCAGSPGESHGPSPKCNGPHPPRTSRCCLESTAAAFAGKPDFPAVPAKPSTRPPGWPADQFRPAPSLRGSRCGWSRRGYPEAQYHGFDGARAEAASPDLPDQRRNSSALDLGVEAEYQRNSSGIRAKHMRNTTDHRAIITLTSRLQCAIGWLPAPGLPGA
jgi:hypothetical protein